MMIVALMTMNYIAVIDELDYADDYCGRRR